MTTILVNGILAVRIPKIRRAKTVGEQIQINLTSAVVALVGILLLVATRWNHWWLWE